MNSSNVPTIKKYIIAVITKTPKERNWVGTQIKTGQVRSPQWKEFQPQQLLIIVNPDFSVLMVNKYTLVMTDDADILIISTDTDVFCIFISNIDP